MGASRALEKVCGQTCKAKVLAERLKKRAGRDVQQVHWWQFVVAPHL